MTSIYHKYIFEIPIIPNVVSQIVEISGDSDISSKELEDILKLDPYLTSRILKVANSSFYSRERSISSVKDAITLIGLKKIKTICLLIASSEIMNNKHEEFYKKYWEEALNTAFIAKEIAFDTGKDVIAEDIFTAGLLHNIGQGILYNFSKDKYNNILQKLNSNHSKLDLLENEEFGVTGKKVASGVLESWSFPKLLVEAVELTLNPSAHSKFQSVIDIVSFSKLLNMKITNNFHSEFDNQLLTYQSRLNLRNTQVEYYINSFIDKVKNSDFYNICLETIFE